jgi:hypothetical protein
MSTVHNILLFGERYNPSSFSEKLRKTFPFGRHNELMELFNSEPLSGNDKNPPISFSLIKVILLLKMSDVIAKTLLRS